MCRRVLRPVDFAQSSERMPPPRPRLPSLTKSTKQISHAAHEEDPAKKSEKKPKKDGAKKKRSAQVVPHASTRCSSRCTRTPASRPRPCRS